MKTLTFTFHAISPTLGSLSRTIELPEDVSWRTISYAFAEFLNGMGYVVDAEAVEGDVDGYVAAVEAVHDYRAEV